MPLKEIIPNIWRASEEDTYQALVDKRLVNFRSIICLRRKLPAWWALIPHELKNATTFLHFPIPPSSDPKCSKKIFEFIRYYMPYMSLPTLIFCKEGRNRTGMIAALIKYNNSYSINYSLKEYSDGVSNCCRETEIGIIKKLSAAQLKKFI